MARTPEQQRWLNGTVKNVMSGDTLIIMGKARGGPPPEKQLTLSSLKAPRLGRRDGASKDEPFAWESKEFLRKLAIGQNVVFKMDYKVQALNNREFGTVWIGRDNLGLKVVENGWAKVNRQGTERSDNFAELEQAETIAKSKELGVWCTDETTLQTSIRDLPGDDFTAADLFRKVGKNNPIKGIVDQVISGSLLRVTVLPEFYSVLVSAAGVQAPSVKRSAAGENNPEPFGPYAKHHTECEILGHDITLIPQGLDRWDNLFAKVLWTKNDAEMDLAKELLKAGLAKTVEFSLAMMASEAGELHALERAAKEEKLRIWTNYVQTPSNSDKLSEKFKGTVLEVLSGDCIVVLDAQNKEHRINLSSIRATRMGSRDRKPEEWAVEAKDFLRKLLIGKAVDVQLEFNRKIPTAGSSSESNLTLQYGHVTFKSQSGEDIVASEVVVENGFANVVNHRTDEQRSCIYDRLLAAEKKAKESRLHIHSGKEAPPSRINDLSNDPRKVKDRVQPMIRNGKMRAIVEHVISGHRLKIKIPSESVVINFALAGVKAPSRAQPARGDKKAAQAELFAEEAWQFTRRRLLQRDVTVQIEAADKGGTFLGTLILADTHLFDLGLELLKNGLAYLHFTFDESRPGGRAYVQAEEMAKKAKKGIWQNYKPEAEENVEDDNGTTSRGRRYAGPLKVAVTHIEDGSSFYIQKLNESKASMIGSKIIETNPDDQPLPASVSKGNMYLAKFSQDNQWYRGIVTSTKPGSYEIFFVDFGNSETIKLENLRPIDPSLTSIPHQAHHCRLAYVKVPSLNADFGYDAAVLLDQFVGQGRECEATIIDRDGLNVPGASKDPKSGPTTIAIMLTPIGATKSVNAEMLEAGYAKLKNLDAIRNSELKESIQQLKPHQDVARKYHKGLFRYGDPGDSDEEELPPIAAKK